ncbi:MAG: V-type ATP synthase subunit A [Synergistaceae bacterium]|jgi:V/A-type H+-transporting ATPase subunit A|nr:V-type ATP synthase subunit A [Synergistaceae bacterium]
MKEMKENSMKEDLPKGSITGVSGPVITVKTVTVETGAAKTDSYARMFEVARIGGASANLLGEVVRIRGKEADVQVYGDTTGLAAGEEVFFTGELLSVDLGPGFLGEILDGLGRFLRIPGGPTKGEIYLEPGLAAFPDERLWRFTPSAAEGDAVVPGDILGTVVEKKSFLHRILIPQLVSTRETIAWIAPEGDYLSRECICRLASGIELSLAQRWAVRVPRPAKARLPLERPLLTGQRALDTLFPLALGGAASVIGGSGTGKTFVQRSLAKYCDADVMVYVGCGGRGGETAEVFEEFSGIESRGIPLKDRTVFVAHTSNMPTAARETGVYLGMTLAEYYRDMGYNAVVMVDSMSRWAEASREIESHLEEFSGERGYPACLGSHLTGYCERAGHVETLGAPSLKNPSPRRGSVSLINAFSLEEGNWGADFFESAAQAGLSAAGVHWKLDKTLAQTRWFPAIDIRESYSLYEEAVANALTHDAGQDWPDLKEYLKNVLLRQRELSDSRRFTGENSLSEEDRWLLFHAETLKIVFLRQSALDAKDACASPASSAAILRLLKALDDRVRKFLNEGLRCDDVIGVSMRPELIALRELPEDLTNKGQEWLELFSIELAKLTELTTNSTKPIKPTKQPADGEAMQEAVP